MLEALKAHTPEAVKTVGEKAMKLLAHVKLSPAFLSGLRAEVEDTLDSPAPTRIERVQKAITAGNMLSKDAVIVVNFDEETGAVERLGFINFEYEGALGIERIDSNMISVVNALPSKSKITKGEGHFVAYYGKNSVLRVIDYDEYTQKKLEAKAIQQQSLALEATQLQTGIEL